MAAPRILAISFDGDGTLWDFQQVMRHALRHALLEIQVAAPGRSAALTIDAMIAIRNQVAEERRGRVTNLEAVRLAAFRRTLRHIGVVDDELAARLNAVYLQHRFADTRPYDDVLPTLDALHARYRLGLVSNGNSYPKRCGLPDHFDFVVFSQDHGARTSIVASLRLPWRGPGALRRSCCTWATRSPTMSPGRREQACGPCGSTATDGRTPRECSRTSRSHP